MSKRDDGGAAFPAQPIYQHPAGAISMSSQNGMTLRDWFAGQAHVADVQFPDLAALAKFAGMELPPDDFNGRDFDALLTVSAVAQAKLRYRIADAMLAERRAISTQQGED